MKRTIFLAVFAWYLFMAWNSNSNKSMDLRAGRSLRDTQMSSLLPPVPALNSYNSLPVNPGNSYTKTLLEEAGETGSPQLSQKIHEDGRVGLIDENGNELAGAVFDELFAFDENGIALARIGDKYGHVNRDGRWTVPPVYDGAYAFDDDVAPVKVGDKWGYVNRDGTTLLEPQFDEIFQFFEDITMFKANGKYGYMHRSGEVILQPIADYVRWFREGKGAVQIDGSYGYINSSGEWIINPQFDRANDFKNGEALVAQDDQVFYIDVRGTYIKPGVWVNE